MSLDLLRTKHKLVYFDYDVETDRFLVGFWIATGDRVDECVAQSHLTNDEYELLMEAVNLDALVSGKQEVIVAYASELEFLTKYTDWDKTNFAQLYNQLVSA